VSQTPRRLLIVTAGAVVAAWAVLYLVVITTAPLSYDPATESAATVNRELALLLTLPTALWVTAALVLVDHWWSRTGSACPRWTHPGGCSRPRWPPSRTTGASGAWRCAPSWPRYWEGRPGGSSRSAAPEPCCACRSWAAGRRSRW